MLTLKNVTKRFPGVLALNDVSIEIRPNEIVGLIGENGAGKSTLMKLLTGGYRQDSGEILRDGKPLVIKNPRDATSKGIAMVYQEQSILPNLTVAENLFLGREEPFLTLGRVNWAKLKRAAVAELATVHLDIDPLTLCEDLTFGQRQMVELAKALSLASRTDGMPVILLDEPTSVLEAAEIEILFRLVRELKARASFVFVSHRLDELLSLSDRVYVMKDGKVVAGMASADASVGQLHELMVGRTMDGQYYRENLQKPCRGEVALSVRNASLGHTLKGVSFDVHCGEVFGVAGVVGSGREELCRVIAGLESLDAGEVLVGGTRLRAQATHAVSLGIGYVPRERKVEGLVTQMSVAENLTLPRLAAVSRSGVVNKRSERAIANEWIERLHIKTPGPTASCRNLSGGNQQKVVLAKWRFAGSRILVLDHPTRGLDVGAKEEVYQLIRELTAEGVAVVLTGDTLEEILGLSHRVMVMRDGRAQKILACEVGHKPSQIDVVEHMV
ncbi:sugar ABC transporter ATP-binding protein [Paraburkholderia phytofirmans]|jgi:ribose transport system ATP-binding protein|uniref:sugar ABC transporter ATP-binding protein n=1 Tax=Paraburkholderia sp. BL9I2N2 TaxID=1938809 RepID=UPI0010501953|nr:sugar ABC transporter ATP-binding protein [Paraburkholderia sp. BL9I2N2]TCK91946.1 monosaccharide ABC transporter ATP-binding protein (CUT2 family) [Paraburkholderia sp. BL9I2N2]